MKILFTSYISIPEYSDPAQWLQRIEAFTGILTALAQQHTVVSIERIQFEGEKIQNGVRYVFFKMKKRTTYIPFRMHRLIKNEQPDVVFINGLHFPLQVIQLRRKLGKKIKIIALHHAEQPPKGLKRLLARWADRCIDHYFFAAAALGHSWANQKIIANKKKIHEVMEASSHFIPGDQASARKQLGITGTMIILWVGRLDANKDPLTVVQAFLQLYQQYPQVRLYMIYQTDALLKEVQQLIKRVPGAAAAIHLVGAVAHEALQNWFHAADVIVSGSHYEGSGIAVCEAMSCGCIPVLTAIPSFKTMTVNGHCGFLYEAGNVPQLLQSLQQCIHCDLQSEKQKVLQQFHAQLSFTAIAQKINEIIQS